MEDHITAIQAAGTTDAASVGGMRVVLLTTRGAKTGRERLIPLMRVEHEGVYLAVASKGGSRTDPAWRANLDAHPRIRLQDGTREFAVTARRIHDDEYRTWWPRAVAAFPPYAEYQAKTQRTIPLYVLEEHA